MKMNRSIDKCSFCEASINSLSHINDCPNSLEFKATILKKRNEYIPQFAPFTSWLNTQSLFKLRTIARQYTNMSRFYFRHKHNLVTILSEHFMAAPARLYMDALIEGRRFDKTPYEEELQRLYHRIAHIHLRRNRTLPDTPADTEVEIPILPDPVPSYLNLNSETDEIPYEEGQILRFQEDQIISWRLDYSSDMSILYPKRRFNINCVNKEASSSTIVEEHDCAICLCIIDPMKYVQLNCNHGFCISCIETQLDTCREDFMPTCALCRTVMSKFEVSCDQSQNQLRSYIY